MMEHRSYRVSLTAAILLHVCILSLFISQPSSERPVLTATREKQQYDSPHASQKEVQTIKAVSINKQEVMETVNRLKEEKRIKYDAEVKKQNELKRLAESARKDRIKEQARLKKLRKEAENLANTQKQKIEKERQRLQELAKKQKREEKRLADLKNKHLEMKKQQKLEAKRVAEEKRKQAEALAQAKREKEALAKAKAEAERKRQEAIEQAALEAENKARLTGEVDKFKALIINAISRQWILPDNIDGELSSQFRIRLAPTGAVLDVSLTRSSGDPILDRSAQAAIYKASPLPVPNDPEAFNLFRDIRLTVRPENVRG